MVLPHGVLAADASGTPAAALAFDPPTRRVFLTATHVRALRHHLEDGGMLWLEVRAARLQQSEVVRGWR